MDDIVQRLQVANRKVTKLEQLIHRLGQEKQELERRLQQLTDQTHKHDAAFTELQQKYEALKLAKGLGNGAANEEDRAAIHEKIDKYLKEIDICLKIFGDQD